MFGTPLDVVKLPLVFLYKWVRDNAPNSKDTNVVRVTVDRLQNEYPICVCKR